MAEKLPITLVNPDLETLTRAARVVRQGGAIVYPTETVYGVGGDATDPSAIRKVRAAKGRTERKPILVLVSDVGMMMEFVEKVSPQAQLLMEKFWPGPLTLVFKATGLVPGELTEGMGTIGVRIPSSPVCLKLADLVGGPLLSTSANPGGEAPARTVAEIEGKLIGIDLILDAGQLPESAPSTVVDVSRGTPCVLRAGAVPFERLRDVVPQIEPPLR